MIKTDQNELLLPIKRQRLAELVLGRMADLIKSGAWRTGEKLPSERELCDQFQVGRSSIREAVKGLEFSGLVEVRPGEGTFVAEDTSSAMGKVFARAVTLNRQDAQDLIEARRLVEAYLAGRAARRISEEGLAELRAHWERMVQTANEPDAFIKADADFHISLARESGNRVLLRVFITIRELLEQFIGHALVVPGTSQAAADDHAKILQAVEGGDATAAEEAMRVHLDDVGTRLTRVLASRQRTQGQESSRLDGDPPRGDALSGQ